MVPRVRLRDRCHRGLRAHRRLGHRGETRHELDHLGHRHEAVGIDALVAIAGQSALPVGRQQPQRVPAFAAPGVGHLAALEHHVIDRALGKAPTRRQPRVAGSYDDRSDVFDGPTPRRKPALYTLPGPLRGPRPTHLHTPAIRGPRPIYVRTSRQRQPSRSSDWSTRRTPPSASVTARRSLRFPSSARPRRCGR